MIRERPMLLIGSPMCTMFSSLQCLSAWNEETDEKWRDAAGHIKWITSLYQKQIDEGRLLLHEHPASASCWNLPSIRKLES